MHERSVFARNSPAGEDWLIASDLRSGELLYKTSHDHNEVAHVNSIILRQPNGEELIVRQWVTNERRDYQTAFGHGASWRHNRGVRIFSGENGQCIQTIETRTRKNSRYSAAFSMSETGYVAEAEEGQKFQHETTEILDDGPPSVTCFHSAISVRSLDPYGYKVAGWDTERQAPYLFSIVPSPAVPEAQKQVTLPPRTDAELETRRSLRVENPNFLPPAEYTAEFEDQDRLVCHDRRRNVGNIFDFGFRAPQALGSVDKGKNKTAMEI
ncbi:hypothetical protein BJX62DRAFT_237629 [Aspergillus germanicus]